MFIKTYLEEEIIFFPRNSWHKWFSCALCGFIAAAGYGCLRLKPCGELCMSLKNYVIGNFLQYIMVSETRDPHYPVLGCSLQTQRAHALIGLWKMSLFCFKINHSLDFFLAIGVKGNYFWSLLDSMWFLEIISRPHHWCLMTLTLSTPWFNSPNIMCCLALIYSAQRDIIISNVCAGRVHGEITN